jgi:hypothetical protein
MIEGDLVVEERYADGHCNMNRMGRPSRSANSQLVGFHCRKSWADRASANLSRYFWSQITFVFFRRSRSAMSKRSFVWKSLTIQFDGRTITGSYAEWKGMVIVKSSHGMKSIKIVGSKPVMLAQNMLRELAAEKRYMKR